MARHRIFAHTIPHILYLSVFTDCRSENIQLGAGITYNFILHCEETKQLEKNSRFLQDRTKLMALGSGRVESNARVYTLQT